MTRTIIILAWIIALTELVGCVLWWPGLIGILEPAILTFCALVSVLGYRFDDGSPRFEVRRALKPSRHASVWLITATVVSWTDVYWCCGALVTIAIIQVFQQPRLQPISTAVAAGVAFLGAASPWGSLDLESEYREVTHWVAPLLACTTGAFLLLAAWAQYLVVRSHEASIDHRSAQ